MKNEGFKCVCKIDALGYRVWRRGCLVHPDKNDLRLTRNEPQPDYSQYRTDKPCSCGHRPVTSTNEWGVVTVHEMGQ